MITQEKSAAIQKIVSNHQDNLAAELNRPKGLGALKTRRALLYCLLLMSIVSVTQAGDKGKFGLVLNVDASGVFHPIAKAIKVEKVVPTSPAAKAGLEAGDLVLEVQGVKVAGATPSELQPALTSTGQTLRLKNPARKFRPTRGNLESRDKTVAGEHGPTIPLFRRAPAVPTSRPYERCFAGLHLGFWLL